MTADPFTEAAYAESRHQWPMRDQRSAFESGARWAQRYLTAQEPTDAECLAVLNAVTTPLGDDIDDAWDHARAALTAAWSARTARRGEEKRDG